MTEFLRTVMATKDVATSLGAVRGVKGVVTFSDTEKDLGRAPVACEWAVPFQCCTVPLDCLLMLST